MSNQNIAQLELSRMLTSAKYTFIIYVKSVIGLAFEILFNLATLACTEIIIFTTYIEN